jgi:hypothetical protein
MTIIVEVSGVLHNDEFAFILEEWTLLKESVAYYEIRGRGKVKRVNKDKLSEVRASTKYYQDGMLAAYAFCFSEKIDQAREDVICFLKNQVKEYERGLELNKKALTDPDSFNQCE